MVNKKISHNLNLKKLLLNRFKLILLGILLMIIGVVLNLIFPLIMKLIVDKAIPNQDTNLLILLIIGLIIIPILSTIFTSFTNIINIEIGGRITDDLREQMFEKIIRLSPKTLNDLKVGDIVGRITRSCGEVGEVYVKNELLPAISSFFMFIGILSFMCLLSWKLALTSLIMVPIIITASRWLGIKSEKKTRQLILLLSKADSYFTELISGMKIVQMFNQEDRERNYIKNWIKEHRKIRNQTTLIRNWFMDILSQFEQSLGLGIVFAVGVWQIANNQLSIGSLIAFTVYIPQLYLSVENIQRAYVGTRNIKPSIQRVQEILNIPDDKIDQPNARLLKSMEGNIIFENVSFKYKDDRGGVQNISFTINPNEIIGIVGPTGGGKSTLLDLLMRFYEPEKGRILIDGIDSREYRLKDLRKQIGIVSQDIFLWNRTIRENLMYVSSNVSEYQIKKILEIVQISDFINNLPKGIDTIIGERGLGLSGGEKQRLAIARALLHNPKILLLDEPTSALDARTETVIQRQLKPIFNGKTVIIVAHRLATIQNADRILVIENGQVIEGGTHKELMKSKKTYYDLYIQQYKTS